MSQFACPLCGKNCSIANYSPDEFDLDLKAVSFGSRGRGGIYVADKTSVLGEGDLSAKVAERTLKLTKMFIESGDLQVGRVLDELGLAVPSADPMEVAELRADLDQAMSVAKVYELDAAASKNSLRVRDEERMLDEEVDRILLRLMDFFEAEVRFDRETLRWSVWVTDIKDGDALLMLVGGLAPDVKMLAFERMKTDDPRLETVLVLLRKVPRRMSIQEMMMPPDSPL